MPNGVFENRQKEIIKKCSVCGKKFKTKLQCGYNKCKTCNGVIDKNPYIEEIGPSNMPG